MEIKKFLEFLSPFAILLVIIVERRLSLLKNEGSATRIQTGTSTASWVQLYNNYNASFPSLSVDFVGSGYFTESRTHSGGGSVNINGFNLTGSTAYTDTYSSDTMSLIWTYKLYA